MEQIMTINNIGSVIQKINSDTTKNSDSKSNKSNKNGGERSSVKSNDNKKNDDKYKSIVKKYYNLFEIIIIALFSSNNEGHKINMELIMNLIQY